MRVMGISATIPYAVCGAVAAVAAVAEEEEESGATAAATAISAMGGKTRVHREKRRQRRRCMLGGVAKTKKRKVRGERMGGRDTNACETSMWGLAAQCVTGLGLVEAKNGGCEERARALKGGRARRR